jgi:hypothetical protein
MKNKNEIMVTLKKRFVEEISVAGELGHYEIKKGWLVLFFSGSASVLVVFLIYKLTGKI